MAALARQNRPAATDSRAVESAAVMFLPVAIVIVTAPARTLRQVALEQVINDFNRIAHNRVVRRADAQPD